MLFGVEQVTGSTLNPRTWMTADGPVVAVGKCPCGLSGLDKHKTQHGNNVQPIDSRGEMSGQAGVLRSCCRLPGLRPSKSKPLFVLVLT